MNQDNKRQIVVAGAVGVAAAGLTLFAASPKVRAAIKDCGDKLVESGKGLIEAAKGGNLVETAKGYAAASIGTVEEMLGALKRLLEPKPEKSDEA